jgi:hexosaminidase
VSVASGWFEGLTPVPAELEIAADEASFHLFSDFTYRVTGSGSSGATAAIQCFLGWCKNVRNESVEARATLDETAVLEVECARSDAAAPGLENDESYKLAVDGNAGRVRISASQPVGVLRGLATLLHLSVLGAGSLRGCEIDDRPRFAWRGLMIDVSRHFIPISALERTLDAMALVKLNVLHLHLTDDQGFRLESRAFPKLHENGSAGEYYSQDEIRALVAFSSARGIRIVPEFDLPGHASSWLAGYPQFGCSPESEYAVVETWGCVDVCVNPLEEELYEFLESFFADILPLFPDEFVHIGGDEVFGEEWRQTPTIAQHMSEHGMDARDLQAHFNGRLRSILARFGKRVIGWDEIAHPDMPTDAVVQSWRGAESVAAVTKQGYASIRSHGYYLNALLPAAEHYAVDPCPAGLDDEAAALVLGGEACMWTEFVDENNLDSRVWPRAAVIAERFWSPRSKCDESTLTVRLFAAQELLRRFGVSRNGKADGKQMLGAVENAEMDGLAPERRDAVIPSTANDRHTPLNRLADLLPAENFVAARLRELVKNRDHERIEQLLEDQGRRDDFVPWGRVSDLDADLLFKRIRRVVDIGSHAVACHLGKRSCDEQWVDEALTELESCAEAVDGVVVAIAEPVMQLVRALRGTRR